jgi:hypothetical protein
MKTGKIVALEVDHFSNAGNTQDLSQGVSRTLPCVGGVCMGDDWEVKHVPHSLLAKLILACCWPLPSDSHPWLFSKAQG